MAVSVAFFLFAKRYAHVKMMLAKRNNMRMRAMAMDGSMMPVLEVAFRALDSV